MIIVTMIGYHIIHLLFPGWILIEEIRDFDNQALRDEILIVVIK